MDMIGMFSIHDTQMTLEKYQTLEDEHSQKEDDSNSFENDDLLEKWIVLTPFLKAQDYEDNEIQQLQNSIKDALKSSSTLWGNGNEPINFINSLLGNLTESNKEINIEDINGVLSNFFSNPDNELEEYGLLTDYVMEARAIRLNSEAKEKQVSKKEALSNWVENAKKAKENLTESNLKETVENQKMITRWRGFIEDATSKIQLPESAKENRKPLDEKTREKLEENGISPESYQTISYLYSDLNGNRENIPSDIFDMLEGNKDRFHSFEEALGISPSFQSLETIPAIKSNANLSALWNPSVYNNISWLHEEAKESVANFSMETEKLSENTSDILDMFPDMVEKWTDNKWKVDSKIWGNISSQFKWMDKAGLETLKQWLVVHQLHKKTEESWIPLDEKWMKERVPSIWKASEMVLQKLHSGSKQVMGEETVHAYCNTISEVCGELGDW
jgi:hypothetical protein